MSEAPYTNENEAVEWYYNTLLDTVRRQAYPSPGYIRNLHERLYVRFSDEAVVRITNAAYTRLVATVIKHNE